MLHYIAFCFLCPRDHCNLVEALAGRPLDVQRRDHVATIPLELSGLWVAHQALLRLERTLYALAEGCLFYAHNYTATLAFVNWSPFAHTHMQPVAEYLWTNAPPFAHVILHSSRMQDAIVDMYDRRLPCAQVTIYSWISWNGHSILGYRPLKCTSVDLLPH